MARRAIATALFLLATWPSAAGAAHTVTVCGETCASGEQCNLGNNLSCAVSPAVTLNAGADLDLKGKTITCSGCTADTSQAIVVNASNSTIEDTVGGGGILGSWGTGIECNNNNGSLVRKVRVDGAGQYGMSRCRKVDGVVVANVGYIGILNASIGASDYIKNSYVVGGAYSIWVQGSGSGSVDHNVIAGSGAVSILLYDTAASLSVTGNSLFPTGYPILAAGSSPIASGNVCGDPSESDCAACISANLCSGPNTPFVGP